MGKFSSGFFWGALIGGTYTLLTAKRSGQETRQLLTNYVAQVQEDAGIVQEDLERAQASFQHLMHDVLPLAQKVTQQVKTELRQFEEANRPRFRRVQARINTLKGNLDEHLSDF
ncbi:YtxH domain-containing protein [Aerococcaceae bacterium NML191292]|nr:YtxH domain-containing protein [Aerococcaceae bacterium NML210727]MCW6655159.1 YtxH domain-containing protein [Aerococcaceae bacterium NML201296]MCW6660371.1 YtxH domain-containing protein [Aerococcaceae bacterium NML191292]MCW6663720.1 YtxH domain-containing protein [Aerococcaceae bacterium NML190073]MCW6666872.1 YtxH domain-containing protein [Aerococcaceae bacterium NML190938]MCW6674891.1 YtxH domain-containing protein [Aerococcaceae bacterium NML171108]MCW6676965.1 YtxH domain-containi